MGDDGPSPGSAWDPDAHAMTEGRPDCACVPDAIPSESRPEHFARLRRLFGRAARHRAPVADGYDFTFDVSELGELAAFVSLERRCCPFLSFALEVASGSDQVRLRVQGPPGAQALVKAELIDRATEP